MKTLLVVTKMSNGCCLYQMIRDQECSYNILQCIRHSPTTKNYLVQNVNRDKVKKSFPLPLDLFPLNFIICDLPLFTPLQLYQVPCHSQSTTSIHPFLHLLSPLPGMLFLCYLCCSHPQFFQVFTFYYFVCVKQIVFYFHCLLAT